jgi:hypothetical protein
MISLPGIVSVVVCIIVAFILCSKFNLFRELLIQLDHTFFPAGGGQRRGIPEEQQRNPEEISGQWQR